MNAIYNARGGYKLNSIYSGQVAPLVARSGPGMSFAGSDVQLQAGNGRLNAIIPHQTYLTLSGLNINLYDAALPVSGGPVVASGHIPLGGLPTGFGAWMSSMLAPVALHFALQFFAGAPESMLESVLRFVVPFPASALALRFVLGRKP